MNISQFPHEQHTLELTTQLACLLKGVAGHICSSIGVTNKPYSTPTQATKQARAMSEDIPVTHTFKVLVLGDSGVGKTSLIKYYTEGEASPSILSTIGR